MKILWISNAPYVPTGYGQQTALFTRLLKDAGHDVVIFPYHGHHGAPMNANGISILPQSLEPWGNDMIAAHVEHYKPDVTVLLADVWVFRPEVVPYLTAWAPVDHDPIPPLVGKALRHAKHTWAMSRFGETQMQAAGLTPDYVPHGVDRELYQPIDRDEARQKWGVKPGQFLAAMVATNKGYPSRKSLDRVLKAWGQFVKTRPDALLYIHTIPGEGYGGIDLTECARFYGVPDANLRFPDLYHFLRSDYSGERMNALYNAADVLVAPSMGEGFGIPVIEAQAAGCPVIVSDFTAQTELVSEQSGYKVPVHDDDRFYTLQNSEQAMLRPSEILKGLEWAFERRGDAGLREVARQFVERYDAKTVLERWMLPALEKQVQGASALEADRQARTAARLALREVASSVAVEPEAAVAYV